MSDDHHLELYRMLKNVCDVLDVLLKDVQIAPLSEEDAAVVREYASMRKYMGAPAVEGSLS